MAAQDAELKLKVSLDLAFFRQQLAGLGQAAAGYNMPINVKFDRRSVQNELNALGANIRRRNYRLNIETNLSAEIAKADTLARKLDELGRKIRTSAGSAFSKGPQGAAGLERFMQEQGLTGRAFGVRQAQENIAKQAILARLEKGSLSKGGYNVKGLEKIIRDLGGTPTGGRTDLVAQAKKLVQESDGIADAVFEGLKDLQMKLKPIRGQAQTSAARSMPNLNQMLDRIANLTENPRAAQRMLRMMPESRLTTDLIGAANRQAAFREQYGPQGFRLHGFNGAKAFDPLLKSIAESFTDYTRTVNASNPWVGKIGSGITQLIGRALTQSPEQMFGGRTPVAGAKLLPAAGQTSGTRLIREQFAKANLPLLQAPSVGQENAPLSRAATYMLNKANRALGLPIGPSSPYAPNPFAGMATVPGRQYFRPTMQPALPAAGMTGGSLSVLERQLAQARGPIGTGGGIASALFSGRGLVNPGVSMLSPMGIAGPYRQMAAALASQAANPALAHRQIADIGFGAIPAAATGLSGQALNAALNQAFMQRRGLGIGGAQSLPIFGTQGIAVQQTIPGMSYRMGGGGMGGSMGMFPMSGMMGPSSPLTINARSSMFAGGGGAMPPGGGGGGGRGGMGGFGGFGRAMGGINLPGAGTIRELGSEFAFATKQVLLFGQAYKMLGFLQDFPGQVGQAVAQLQTFRNTLGAVSTSAEDAAESNQMILDLVDKYNVPLQSARDGFTKLYASMAPAGFSGDEIRDLFTGITQAAATFGMSADKVDRVNYAFAQMASKGQVMSEELKGQLGDVLPGAMAIFAEAAGFEGPKAIQEFSAALEDGVYKGEAMNALLKNVGIVMKQEFGPGAEGAARTFQGVINRMQNSMQLLYESFEPVAIGFLNSVVMPLTEGIKTVSDGFTSFFTGAAAKTVGGSALAQQLQQLKPSFDGIQQNLKDLLPLLTNLGQVAINIGKVFIDLAGSPLAGYLIRVYATVLPLVAIIKALNLQAIIPLIASTLRAIPAFVAFNAAKLRLLSTNKALQLSMQLTGSTAAATAGKIRMVGLALGSLVAPAILLGIGALIERFMMLKGAVDGVAQSTKAMLQSVSSMANSGAVAALQNVAADTQKQIKTFENLRPFVSGGALGPARKLTPEAARKMQEVGLGSFLGTNIFGQQEVKDFANASKIIEERLKGLRKTLASTQEKLPLARRVAADIEAKTRPQELAPIPEVAAEGGAKGTKAKALGEYDRSQLTFIQQQFEKEKQILEKRLQGELISQTQYDIALAELKLETEQLEIAEKYRLAVEKTNKDNLSAADKALKLKDLEIAKNNDLAIAQENRNIAVGAARQKIIAPILSEIDNETAAIERQTARANALKEGRLDLSAAQEAELSVKERYLSLSQDERDLAKGELEVLRQIREQRLRNAEALQLQMSLQEKINETRGIGGGLRAGFFGQAAGVFERAMFESDGNVDYATQMANLETAAMQLRSVFEGLQSAIGGVSEAFANVLTEGVAGMIAGTATAKEVFADFLRSIGQSLLQAASQMISTYIAIGIAKAFAGLGGGKGPGVVPGVDVPIAQMPAGMAFANGGIAKGGFQAFANGGVVTGPTLGLVGEGKYNEAIVPLPDGRSIPVQLGGRSARDMMGSNAPGMPQAPSLSMKFETTKINGVEYVSREQLEQAMAETRRASIAGGARQGMSMTLDKIKQSPTVRSRIGIR